MRRPRGRWVAGSVVALTGAMYSASLVLAGPWRWFEGSEAVWPLPFLAFAVGGAWVAFRRPENATGWILLAIGSLMMFSGFARTYATQALVNRPGSLPLGREAAWLGLWTWAPAAALFGMLFLLFPSGRPPSPRWRWVVRFFVAWLVALLAAVVVVWPRRGPAFLIEEGSIGKVSGLPILDPLANLGFVAMIVLGVAALIARFRRSRSVERQQLKWLALAGGVMLVSLASGFFVRGEPIDNPVYRLLFFTASMAVPLAVAVAILRHRLYDIDVVINRTLVYGALTASLGLVYVAGVVGLPRLLPLAEHSDLLVAASTLAVAALFSPLRRRIQDFVDRRFYRSRYDAHHTVEAFGARLRHQVDLEHLLLDLEAVGRETLQPASVRVWLREPRARA